MIAFAFASFTFQIVLICHFILRRFNFPLALRYGPIVYALGVPAALLSVYLLTSGTDWGFWLGGFLYLAWGAFGYWIEYIRNIQWRSPIFWPVFIPYIVLYLATVMFYWWPLSLIWKPLWYIYLLLFLLSTLTNLASHNQEQHQPLPR
jgi:hypothetical protein